LQYGIKKFSRNGVFDILGYNDLKLFGDIIDVRPKLLPSFSKNFWKTFKNSSGVIYSDQLNLAEYNISGAFNIAV
jgi:hypothetical protein